MTKTTLFLSILATGLLALGGVATAVAAQGPGEADSRRDQAQERRDQAQERRDHASERADDARERAAKIRQAHDAWQDCKESHRNASLNESVQRHCMAEKSFFLNATHAKREGRAVYGAIAALERQIGRLEVREMALEEKIASGNLTANETAKAESAIAKIDAAQERLAEKLEKLKARLDALQEKWQTVRDHVQDRRHGEDDEAEDEDEADDESSSSSSSSASASSSESSTSGSP